MVLSFTWPFSLSGVEAALSDDQLNQLRALRAEVLGLQRMLEIVRKGEMKLVQFTDYVKGTITDIAALVPTLKNMGKTDVGCDAVYHICNTLEQMEESPLLKDPGANLDADVQLHYLNTFDAQCRRLVYEIGVLTIPPRVNTRLKAAWPGFYIPFHAVFDDELPNLEDRERVLKQLMWAPKSLHGGLVDLGTGLIYKYSQNWIWLIISAAVVAGTVVGTGLGMQWIQANWSLLTSTPPAQSALMLWLAVVAGVIFHVIVGTAKRAAAHPSQPPILAFHTLFPLLNARLGQLLFKLLLTIVGFLGLVFAIAAKDVTLLNAFLIGYSLDSVVELFGTSVEQQAARSTTQLKQQLGVTTQ